MAGLRFMTALAAGAIGLYSGGSAAADEQMICALTQGIQCTADGRCVGGNAEAIGLPTLLRVDLTKRQVSSTDDTMKSPIGSLSTSAELVTIQGAENGRAWSATIGKKDGHLSATIAGDNAGFVVFGKCAEI